MPLLQFFGYQAVTKFDRAGRVSVHPFNGLHRASAFCKICYLHNFYNTELLLIIVCLEMYIDDLC